MATLDRCDSDEAGQPLLTLSKPSAAPGQRSRPPRPLPPCHFSAEARLNRRVLAASQPDSQPRSPVANETARRQSMDPKIVRSLQ